MASRTKQKEEARARRLAEERARLERERRQRRLRMLSGVVLAAVAVVAVAIAVSTGGSGSGATGLQTGAGSTKLVSQVTNQLSGVPQSGAVLGNPKAPVTMTYYGDLECPVCRDFTLSDGFSQLVANDVRAGKVKVVYRSFQTASPNAQTFETQQIAALAAGKQNRFWNYLELFYRQQGAEGTGYVTASYLNGLARQIPDLNFSAWGTARNDPSLSTNVILDVQAGTKAGVRGTPTLILSGPKGQALAPSALPSYSDLERTIKSVA
jgi:protein-disulfide isomerase